MPTRSSSLPIFSIPGANNAASSRALFFIPRSYLSPRIFLSCILATFSLSWLLLYSYSHSSFSSARDSEEWILLEQRLSVSASKTMQRSNSTLTSSFSCHSPTSSLPSIRGPGFNRETICVLQNLCIDAERGAWIHTEKSSGEFPRINVVAADPGSDEYYRPMVLDQFPVSSYRFVDETIFLYGRDPTNRPTWTLNNLMPLHSVMSSFEGSKSSWFMRVSGEGYGDNKRRQQYRILDREQELDTYLLAPHGHEIVFNSQKGKPLAAHQISAPSKSFPTCFARAVIGLQSRCTRPFCENLIGGGDLTEALRTKVLDVLSPSMFRFEKADPSIVHAPSAENVAVVSNDNLAVVEGESAPRSKIEVALLGRYGNTSIPNANMLEVSLLARGFAVKTIHLDYPSEISLAQAAQLFRNETILVAPQGDALGYSTLMAPGTVVVSILPRFTRSSKIYTDRMMAFGKRFFAWDCQDETCVQPDRDLAHECIEAIQDSYKQEQGISAQDFEEFANMRQDFRQRSEAWKAIANCYTRDVSRRLNVEELTTLIEGLAKDFTFGMAGNEGKKLGDEPMLMRRAGPEDDLMEGDVEEGEGEGEEEEDPAAGGDNTDVLEDDGQTEDQEEGDVRIQDDQEAPLEESETSEEGEEEEGSGQDINMHEYDEQEGPAPDAKEEEHHKAPNTPATPSPSTKSDEPSPAPAPNTPKTKPESSYYEMKYRRAEPLFGFAEFCRRGRCCGSGKISGDEASHAGGKSLTPCGHSMSRIVFGAKGAWGLTDKVVSEQEAQSLVWEVDLGRRS